MSGFWAAVGALLPPIGVGLVFWLVMRWIVQADRRERAAQAALDARDAAVVPPAPTPAENAADAGAGPSDSGHDERPAT